MKEIDFVDTTLRDGQASLWGERMNTAMMYKVAPEMERARFRAIDVTAMSHLEFAVRFHREDPWERLRLLSEVISDTPLSIMMPGNSISLFRPVAGSLLALFMQRLAANGIRRVQVTTVRGDISSGVRYARESGLEVAIALSYTMSPVHTDAYYEQKTQHILGMAPDVIYIKDAGGLLTPERVRTLVPAIQRHLDGMPLEIHSHCTTGLAPICYVEAMKLGVRTFHTAVSPLANGPSQPSIENVLKNARSLGYSSRVDEQAVEAIAAHFRNVASIEGFPTGVPLEYDIGQYAHQVPGGVISNLTRQLAELGLGDRLEDVLEETVRVRREFGYPIMITPFSQFVVTQAMLNVTQGERYRTITDPLIHFALGHYGKHDIPIDPDIMDRILSMPQTKDFLDWQPEEITIDDLRQQYGAHVSDDDLLLAAICREDDIKAMRKAGPINLKYPQKALPHSIANLIGNLAERRNVGYLDITNDDISLRLRRTKH